MSERDFVLQPLMDIEPEWIHPVLQRTVADLMQALVVDNREFEPYRVLPLSNTSVLPYGKRVR